MKKTTTWIVETGINYLGTDHFTVHSTYRFSSKRLAAKFFEDWAKMNCKGGSGYWHHMPVPSVRMYKVHPTITT